MRTDQPVPAPVRLQDYRPPAFRVETVELAFDLQPRATRVRARLSMVRQGEAEAPLVLDGVRLKLLSASVDGRELSPADYRLDAETLCVPGVPDAFTLETEVEIDPQANTALEGLYISGGRFCTQCEAEGFRKITFFPDRPDVLARYTVRIEADAVRYPRLLSNGNLMEAGALDGGRHFAVWTDPFPKPCYLFALVAGELDELADGFTTMSGREVALRIYVDPGQSARAAYAMDALKRSMRFDETAFGREYDLDLFMIVAVRDFNFGAMENKGLNIFNSSLLLADPETATDADYERIESVIAHEYFHNWTGDRITCRDWFQLCLKEGLTVFRDQAFSAQERGAAVQRIKDVRQLRARQFPEDAGPPRPPGASVQLSEDRQLLHRDDLREGRGDHPHAVGAARPGGLPARARPLLRALGRDGHHGGGVRRLLRAGLRARSDGLHALVRAGGHAAGVDRGALRRGGAGAGPDAAPADRADPGPAGQAAPADPAGDRPAGRRRRAARLPRPRRRRGRRAGPC